jgi:hypothetical protein
VTEFVEVGLGRGESKDEDEGWVDIWTVYRARVDDTILYFCTYSLLEFGLAQEFQTEQH